MKFNIIIDQVKSLEWGLNSNQSALFSVLYNISNWAKYFIIDTNNGFVYYHASRNMIIKEIPLFYSKPDTVYRAYMELWKIGIIDYQKLGDKDLIRITEKGKTWNNYELGNKSDNSEINPSELGNKSEYNSEINPTNNNTNIDHNTNIIFNWKNDFEIYKDSLRKSVKELLSDKEYIQQQEKFNPNVNIKLTIEKACINYWATEAGWKHKKKSRSKELDWKSTITNAISSPMNRVYIARQNQEITYDVSKKYINAETYKREGYDR